MQVLFIKLLQRNALCLFAIFNLIYLSPVYSAQTGSLQTISKAYLMKGAVVKMLPTTRIADLVKFADNQPLETQNGAKITVGQLRMMMKISQRLHSPHKKKYVPAVSAGAATIKLRNAEDLRAALTKKGNTVLELKSGKKLTTAQLKLMRKDIERVTGKSMSANRTANEKVVRVKRGASIAGLLKKSGDTILENEKGQRVTVAKLKEYIQKNPRSLSRPGKTSSSNIIKTSSGKIYGPNDYDKLLLLPDSEKLFLPNNKVMTVGELRANLNRKKHIHSPLPVKPVPDIDVPVPGSNK